LIEVIRSSGEEMWRGLVIKRGTIDRGSTVYIFMFLFFWATFCA
jgi:hypothetical protein